MNKRYDIIPDLAKSRNEKIQIFLPRVPIIIKQLRERHSKIFHYSSVAIYTAHTGCAMLSPSFSRTIETITYNFICRLMAVYHNSL